MNVLHFSYTGSSPTSTDCQNIATKLSNQFATGVLSQIPASTVLTSVVVTDIGIANGYQGIWSGSHPGVNVGAYLPASSTFVVRYTVNARYRGGHPRSAYPPMPQTALSDANKWVASNAATYLGDIQTALQGMAGFVSGATTITQQVVVSYWSGRQQKQNQHGVYKWIPIPRTPPLVLPVVGWSYKPTVGSARKRIAPG
jgi:hypothetical protein